jgi:hypothetical protein
MQVEARVLHEGVAPKPRPRPGGAGSGLDVSPAAPDRAATLRYLWPQAMFKLPDFDPIDCRAGPTRETGLNALSRCRQIYAALMRFGFEFREHVRSPDGGRARGAS